jgi:hypothetical protein
VLDKSMMRRYKRVVEEEEDTSRIEVNVKEGWELLLQKGGSPASYHDAVLKVECGNLVEDLIAGFGRRHGVCGDALTNYVGGFLHRLFSGDRLDPYYPLEEEQSDTKKDGEDENDEVDDRRDEDGDDGGGSERGQ